MEGSINCNQGVEITLQKVEFKSSDYRSLQKIRLTVVAPHGKQTSYSQTVRYKLVSFHDQNIKILSCRNVLIKLDSLQGVNSVETQLGSFEVDVDGLRASKQMRAKLSNEIRSEKCIANVHYEILLTETERDQESERFQQLNQAKDSSKTLETRDESEYPSTLTDKRAFQKKQTGMDSCSTSCDPIVSIITEDTTIKKYRAQEKSVHSGTITEKYEDELDEEVLQILPIKKNRMDGGNSIKFAGLKRSSSMNVQIRRSVNAQTPADLQKINHIRSAAGKKLRPVAELQEKIQTILFLKYLSSNKVQLQNRLSSKSNELQKEFDEVKQNRDEVFRQQSRQQARLRLVKNKYTMAGVLLAGVLINVLF